MNLQSQPNSENPLRQSANIRFKFSNRHALICGATSGIGRATAIEFARAGAELTLLARREGELERVKRECLELGSKAVHSIAADLEKPQTWGETLDVHFAKHPNVGIFINNSGGPSPGQLSAAAPADIEIALQRLLFSAHLILQKMLPGMKQNQFGRIINVISTSVREPIANLGVSNVVRGATASWAKTLANELPPGITINNVLPGYTKTERTQKLKTDNSVREGKSEAEIEQAWILSVPERRLADPIELANTILFLSSEEAGYIRGVSLAVDGGRMKSI